MFHRVFVWVWFVSGLSPVQAKTSTDSPSISDSSTATWSETCSSSISPTPLPTQLPHDVIDLCTWKLQLPYFTGTDSIPLTNIYTDPIKPTEVTQHFCKLRNFKDDQLFYAGCDASDQVTSEDQSCYVVFKTPVRGLPTLGSKHSRLELVEMEKDYCSLGCDERKSPQAARWDANDGNIHTLDVSLRVTHVPAHDRTVTFAQLFKTSSLCGTRPGFLVEFMYDSGRIVAMHSLYQGFGPRNIRRQFPLPFLPDCSRFASFEQPIEWSSEFDRCFYVIDNTHKLSTRFSLRVRVLNALAQVYYSKSETVTNQDLRLTISLGTKRSQHSCLTGHFFKAGNYQQSCSKTVSNPCDSDLKSENDLDWTANEYAEVHFFSATVQHKRGRGKKPSARDDVFRFDRNKTHSFTEPIRP